MQQQQQPFNSFTGNDMNATHPGHPIHQLQQHQQSPSHMIRSPLPPRNHNNINNNNNFAAFQQSNDYENVNNNATLLNGRVTATETKLAQLESRLGQLQSFLGSVDSRLSISDDSHNSRATLLEGRVHQLESWLTALQSNYTTKIMQLGELVRTLDNRVTLVTHQLQQQVTDLAVRYEKEAITSRVALDDEHAHLLRNLQGIRDVITTLQSYTPPPPRQSTSQERGRLHKPYQQREVTPSPPPAQLSLRVSNEVMRSRMEQEEEAGGAASVKDGTEDEDVPITLSQLHNETNDNVIVGDSVMMVNTPEAPAAASV
eukprot:PhM_4_TR2245/c1_g1_i1/m.22152